MPKFSNSSIAKLKTCHEDLQIILNEVIKYFDFTIIYGYRDKEEQNKAFVKGKSKLKFPNSKHNKYPSLAVDIAPYPIDWKDLKRFYYLAGLMKGISYRFFSSNKILHLLRWGGDWDNDNDFRDQDFNDLCHFELINKL